MPDIYRRCDKCIHWDNIPDSGTGLCLYETPGPTTRVDVLNLGQISVVEWPIKEADKRCHNFESEDMT